MRQDRRAAQVKAKARTLRNAAAMRIAAQNLTPRWVGKATAQHNTCPCWMCQYDGHRPDFDKANPMEIFE